MAFYFLYNTVFFDLWYLLRFFTLKDVLKNIFQCVDVVLKGQLTL